jgi:UDP-glucose 4-epimerase
MAILVTGGTGYIGSHTTVELINSGYEVVVVDNLSNSKASSLLRIEEITGKRPLFYEIDLLDRDSLYSVFKQNKIDAVIHFAALKAVGESVACPLLYYQNNLQSTLNLLDAMVEFKCNRIVFSSSATVYGLPKTVPIKEDFPLSATNPYGQTKLMIEQILKDTARAFPEMSVSILRYFNPIGAHKSGLIGEDPKGIPNNLVPYVAKVAAGQLDCLHVFGNDYPTHDGTGVRDYIHVVDLARAHIAALRRAEKVTGAECFNIGTGNGYSVLDIVKAYEEASGTKIRYQIDPRRPGDIATCYADPSKARDILGWEAEYDLKNMCEDTFRWQSKNPDGLPNVYPENFPPKKS